MTTDARLEELLTQPETKEALRAASHAFYDSFIELMPGQDEEILRPILLRASRSKGFTDPTNRLVDVLRQRVLDRIEFPRRLNEAELRSIAEQELLTLPELFDSQYERFVGACLDLVTPNQLLVNEFEALPRADLEHELFTIRTSLGRIDCRFVDQLPITELFHKHDALVTLVTYYDTYAFIPVEQPVIECRVEATSWSPRAFDAFTMELRDLIPTVIRTLVLGMHFAPPHGLDPEVAPGPDLPDLRPDQTGWDLARYLVELHFEKLPKKQSLSLRLQTAQRLLLEADRTRHAAVGTVLCFAALEALLLPDSKAEQISDSLARAATNLLQPDPLARRANRQAIKRLYNTRSRLVHGASADEDDSARDRSRLLASGAIKGVLEWIRFRGRFDDDALRSEDLLEALKDADDGKRMIGVPDELAACLPK